MNRKTVIAAVFVLVLLASVVVISFGYFDGAPGTEEPKFGGPPTEEWNRTYGEESGEERAFLVYSLTQVDDSYVLIGDAEVPTKMENSWFGVADETGELTTRKVVGDGNINTVVPTEDRGAVVAIDGVDRTSKLVKFDLDGSRVWEKGFSHIGPSSSIDSVAQAGDGFVVAGATHELGEDTGFDMWVAKVGSDGEMIWEEWFDKNGSVEKANSVVATRDGGFVVAGNSWRYSGGERVRPTDPFLVKINSEGEKLWETVIDGRGNDPVGTVVETDDGGIVLTGERGNMNESSQDASDIRAAKLTELGELAWNTSYDFGNLDRTGGTVAIPGGGVLIAGSSIRSTGIQSASTDMWVTKVDTQGEMAWREVYGLNASSIANTGGRETPASIHLSDEGELLLAGYVSTPPGSEGFLAKLNQGRE